MVRMYRGRERARGRCLIEAVLGLMGDDDEEGTWRRSQKVEE